VLIMTTNSPQPIGACAVILNTEGKVLLGKRKNSYKSGCYGLPGGRIELNEPITAAIHREVLEETGLDLNNLEYSGVVRENQDKYDFIHFVFAAKNVTQSPVLIEPEKCEGWEWFAIDQLPELILPGHAAAIQTHQGTTKLIDIVM
jgi:8-oxo-dGTP diphosphatase